MSEQVDPSLIEDQNQPDGPDVPEVDLQDEEEGSQPAPSPASKDDVASIVAEAMSRIASQKSEPQQPQLTPEEINERLRVAKFDDKFATQLHQTLLAEEFNPQDVVQIFNDLRDRLMNQATTYSQLLTEKMRMDLDAKYEPVIKAQQQQAQAQIRDRFFKTHPTLKPFGQLMPIAAQNVVNSGKQFGTEAEEFKAVAQEAEKLIKTVNPDFKLGQAKSGGPKPASMMRGGGGGVGEKTPVRSNGADPSLL
jgi:hypothetical protein